MTKSYNEKSYEVDYENIVDDTTSNGGVYLVNIHTICATVLDDALTYVDKYGLKFIGLKGDYRIIDSTGNIYYMNKHLFKCKYSPVDLKVFNSFKQERGINV